MRVVTEEHITPHGWVCEACDREFRPGDIAYDVVLAVADDSFIMGDWRCEECFNRGLPVLE